MSTTTTEACSACQRTDGGHESGCVNDICATCGAYAGNHKLGCAVLTALRDNLGEPPATGDDAEILEEGDESQGNVIRDNVIVDGAEARVVFERPDEPRFELDDGSDDTSVLKRIADTKEEEERLHTVAKRATNAYREAKARTDAAVLYAAEFYARTRQIEMRFTVPREESELE